MKSAGRNRQGARGQNTDIGLTSTKRRGGRRTSTTSGRSRRSTSGTTGMTATKRRGSRRSTTSSRRGGRSTARSR